MKHLIQFINSRISISFIDSLYTVIKYRDVLLTTLPFYQKFIIRLVNKRQKEKIDFLKKEKMCTVAFFIQSASIWKYDVLYKLLEASPYFNPILVISPYNVHYSYDNDECLAIMQQTILFAQNHKYNFLSSYDFSRKKWIDPKPIIKPDVVFFTKPYKDTIPNCHIYHYTDCLSLYAPYGFLCIDNFRSSYNLTFHNLLWRFLVETEYQKGFSKQYSLCKAQNTTIVGAIGDEILMRPDYQPKDVWKSQSVTKKRIIWAPHHTVDYLFNFSNFLVYCDRMLELAEKYKDKVQFAFKPHPVLKVKLINIWGKEKTEAYYQKWNELENTQIEEGYYMDLFKTSDALIHDCASFTAEYLYTQKPTLFMVRDKNVLSHWNPFGKKCFDQHYHAENLEQIEHFIQDVVINGNDPMKQQREQFFKDYLYPKDGVMPSQKIMNILKEELGK